MKIYITRHGMTDNNKEGFPFHSNENPPLNKEGEEQAYNLSCHLKNIPFDTIYTSPMERTLKTAKIINQFHNARIIKDKRLKEVDFGIFDGKSLYYVKKNYEDIYEERKKDKFNYTIPEGESYREAYYRIKDFFESVEKESNILIVTHGTILKLILMYITGKSLNELEQEHYAQTCLFAFENSSTIKWNNTEHLE